MTYLVIHREIEPRLDRRPSFGRTHKWPLCMSYVSQDRCSRHYAATEGIDVRADETRDDYYWDNFDRGSTGRYKVSIYVEQTILMEGY